MPKTIEGLAELQRAMKVLPQNIQKNVMVAAVRGGGRELINQSKKNLPPGYFTIKKSLKIKKRRSKRPYEVRFTVHPERGRGAKFDAWYAHIVENGAQPHEIEPLNRKALSVKGPSNFGNIDIAFGKVHHPGVRPTKFMYRAFRREKQILAAMVKAGRRSFKRLKIKRGL